MKKSLILGLLFLLVGTAVYAQTAGTNGRQPRVWDQAVSSVKLQSAGTDYTDNTTAFTNLVVTGNQATGNAGYIILTAVDKTGAIQDYYLWMDATTTAYGTQGQLRFASFGYLTSVPSVMTSFPYGDWRQSTGFSSSYSVSSH